MPPKLVCCEMLCVRLIMYQVMTHGAVSVMKQYSQGNYVKLLMTAHFHG